MARRLLILEDRAVESLPALNRLLPPPPAFHCERVAWDSGHSTPLPNISSDLIIASASDEPARALALLDWVRRHPMAAPTLAVLPAEADRELLRKVAGVADDFLLWPFRPNEFHERIERLLPPIAGEIEAVKARLGRELGLAQLVGEHPTFIRTVENVPPIAASDAPVLLSGETGTGKELFARAIHHLSSRQRQPFVPVDCAALPEHLAENELFGHVRGAYTDAHADQPGLASVAEGGTLFLDEVDSLSPATQAKLLRFLEEGAFRALGAVRFTQARARVIAATNRPLDADVREGKFRPDLFFRLNVLELRLPPLRERRADVGHLARHFLESRAGWPAARPKLLSPGALRVLEDYDWPGNVRELFNVLQRALVFSAGSHILPNHISLPGRIDSQLPSPASFRQRRLQAIEQFERAYLEDSLRKHRGNITRAARDAGQDRRAFGRLAKKYGVRRENFS